MTMFTNLLHQNLIQKSSLLYPSRATSLGTSCSIQQWLLSDIWDRSVNTTKTTALVALVC